MKTLRKIGMALFAIFLCVNLVACGDDEDETPSVNYSKMIVGTWEGYGHDDLFERLEFNNDGSVFVSTKYPFGWSTEIMKWSVKEGFLHYYFQDSINGDVDEWDEKILTLNQEDLVLFQAGDPLDPQDEDATYKYKRVK